MGEFDLEPMRLALSPRHLNRTVSAPRRSRRQHLSNLILIVLAGLTVFNIKSFWYGIDAALDGYTDFSAFYSGARIVRDGSGPDLYDYETQEKLQKQLYATAESRTGPAPYYHPPFEILAFLPLTYMPYPRAYWCWVIINLIILLAVPMLLLPHLMNLRPVYSINVVLSFFGFFPNFIAVYQGQDSIVLLLLFASAFISLKRGRPFWAGVLLGLGLFRFQLVAPFMLLFLIKRQWKVIQGFSAAALVVGTISVFITGWQGSIRYLYFLWEINQNLTDTAHQVRFALYPRAMTSLRGLLFTLSAGHLSDAVITIISLLGSLLILLWLYVYLRKRISTAADIDMEFSMGIVVVLLVGFHVHLHDWSLLMLPILLVSNRLAALNPPLGLELWTLRFTTLLLLMTPVYVVLIGLEFSSILFIPLLLFGGLIESAKPLSGGSQLSPVGAEG